MVGRCRDTAVEERVVRPVCMVMSWRRRGGVLFLSNLNVSDTILNSFDGKFQASGAISGLGRCVEIFGF